MDNDKKSCVALLSAYFIILIEGELSLWRMWVFIVSAESLSKEVCVTL